MRHFLTDGETIWIWDVGKEPFLAAAGFEVVPGVNILEKLETLRLENAKRMREARFDTLRAILRAEGATEERIYQIVKDLEHDTKS